MKAFASAALVLLIAPVAALADVCPTNSFSAGGNGFFETYSSTAPHDSWGGLSYDLVAGTLQGGNTGSGEAGTFAELTIQDRYVIVGPASGTPIPLQVRLRFTGTGQSALVFLPELGGLVCLRSYLTMRLASASLTDEVSVDSGPCGPEPSTFDETLELAIEKLPGEEFVLSGFVHISCQQSTQATASGVLSFNTLPPGYVIQSCQGYAGQPVAVKSRSWGAVKQLYR